MVMNIRILMNWGDMTAMLLHRKKTDKLLLLDIERQVLTIRIFVDDRKTQIKR